MIRTRGLTHIALPVADLDRSIAFYRALLDARVLVRDERVAEIGIPGAHDVITLEKQDSPAALATHIGFRLIEPAPMEDWPQPCARREGRRSKAASSDPGCRLCSRWTRTATRSNSGSNL